jgi:hypothetical protein
MKPPPKAKRVFWLIEQRKTWLQDRFANEGGEP